MDRKSPIGLFDSGLGGLTVMQALVAALPGEDIIYYGDTAHLPYGNKSREQLIAYAQEITDFMLLHDAKAIVAACGTHSSTTLGCIAHRAGGRLVLGVVRPAVQLAWRNSPNHDIGVAATEATIHSGAYARALAELDPTAHCHAVACPSLVPLIESDVMDEQAAYEAVQQYVQPLKEKGMDTLILGCTHYPLLSGIFQKLAGPEVSLIDPAQATVSDLIERLNCRNLLGDEDRAGRRRIFVSGSKEVFLQRAERLFPELMAQVELI